jgi:lipid-binding SYLF domain-containing protein
MTRKGSRTGSRPSAQGICAALALLLLVGLTPTVGADDALDAKQLVERANQTIKGFASDKVTGPAVRDLLKKAKGVYIAPAVLRGAFIVGVSGGSGVLLSRVDGSKWNGPAFYTIGEASFGLQAGGDKSEVLLLIMTDRGVTSLLGNSVKLGADASVAAGPVGTGGEASTAGLSADILSFTRSKGLYGGVSLEGAVVGKREGMNEAYYGRKDVTPTDILVKGSPSNNQAAGLKKSLNQLASAPAPAKKK